MSYLNRWMRQNQSLASRSMTLIGKQQGNLVNNSALIGNQAIKPLYQITTTPFTTSQSRFQFNQNELPKKYGHEKASSAIKDNIEYKIRFKDTLNVKKVFKEFYSIYGPLFMVCHVSISLVSLGFCCSLVYFTVDLAQVLPDRLLVKLGEIASSIAEGGGKFVLAYALHKMMLPFRLLGAIGLTRLVARKSRAIQKRKEQLKT